MCSCVLRWSISSTQIRIVHCHWWWWRILEGIIFLSSCCVQIGQIGQCTLGTHIFVLAFYLSKQFSVNMYICCCWCWTILSTHTHHTYCRSFVFGFVSFFFSVAWFVYWHSFLNSLLYIYINLLFLLLPMCGRASHGHKSWNVACGVPRNRLSQTIL